ncbi:MAG: hypothetical protein ABIL76_07270, partial [candidate division WOR-3 bacterium]
TSARVLLVRYVKNGYVIRLKRNVFILKEKWENLSLEQKFYIANILQVPSYISCTTALSYYGYTTQVQQNFIESVGIYRTKQINVENSVFKYIKLNKKYYFDFIKKDNFFIATPEKAFIDSLYLMIKGRYSIDLSAVDQRKFDKNKIAKILKKYPQKISKAILNLCKI